MGSNMEQESGDYSNNIQAGGSVTIGLTYDSARQIALDVFQANFYEFSEKAAKKALDRAEEITDNFIKDFFTKVPHLVSKLEEPSVQDSMFRAQKEYAKTGDKQLEISILDLLINRIDSDERSLKQIVLDEAISVIPKLTNEQVNALSLMFSAVLVNHREVVSLDTFKDFINNDLLSFLSEKIDSPSFFNHLQFSGCCTILPEGSTYKPLEEIFQSRYKGFFCKGFTIEEFKAALGEESNKCNVLLTSCLQNPTKLQLSVLNDEALNSRITELSLTPWSTQLNYLFNSFLMNENEAITYINSINTNTNTLFTNWKEKAFKTLQLTSVGYAIAILNYNRHTGKSISLDHFI